jgi:hypothetical protein
MKIWALSWKGMSKMACKATIPINLRNLKHCAPDMVVPLYNPSYSGGRY